MNITLNGQSAFTDMTCISGAPTILKVSGGAQAIAIPKMAKVLGLPSDTMEEQPVVGIGVSNPTKIEMTIANFILNPLSEYYIDVNGVRVEGVFDAVPNGLAFYLTTNSTPQIKAKVAASIVTALKRIPKIAADFKVWSDGAKVILESYQKYNVPITITTNLAALSISKTEGSTASELVDGVLKIDVFKSDIAPKYGSSTTAIGNYICTLEKNMMIDDIAFELGRVFETYTEDGEVGHFQLRVYQETATEVKNVTTYYSIYNVNGYMINQGGTYLTGGFATKLAANVYRGEVRNYINNTILYVYKPTIELSLFIGQITPSNVTLKIDYVDSSGAILKTNVRPVRVSNALEHINIPLDEAILRQSKYVDIAIVTGNLGTLRYNVIKPTKATNECQRIYWYNSYGGISFFDFTGNRTEERKVSTTTYERSRLKYYDGEKNERDEVYRKTNDITVKLSTHNMTEDAQWALFDLQNSRNAWTEVNGQLYKIIVSDVNISLTNVSDIYTAEVKYQYSMGDNL